MGNINSFADNQEKLTNNVNNALSMLEAINESIYTDSDTVTLKTEDGSVSIPSYANIVTRLERAENTVKSFVEGKGLVQTDDNTYRRIKVTAVPKAPGRITSIENPTSFKVDSNWMFEELMFPKCQIEIDLKGKIDDYADRVLVNRVILADDGTSGANYNFFTNNINGSTISYPELINQLNINQIPYSEDTETLDLPMSYERFVGDFTIEKYEVINGITWYYLNDGNGGMNYYAINKDGIQIGNAYNLSKGSYLRYNDSLFRISDIDFNLNRITIEYKVGYENPITGGVFSFYNEPYETKLINIPFGPNELDIVYFKAINEEYNILSHEWSEPIMFRTNELTLENSTMDFRTYYRDNVVDLGAYWQDLAKTNNILTSETVIPAVPVLDASSLQVVQINKQLEATFNSKEYNTLVREVESTRSEVNSLNANIASYKNSLVTETSEANITNLKNLIDADTAKLQNATQRYESAVTDLNTLINKAGAISYSPKYHIRGFFPIPEPTNGQEIIGFDIMYRYKHTNDSGVELDTFNYVSGRDSSGNDVISKAVFSDWNLVSSLTREQVYDEESGKYVWKSDKESDGDAININQIDIPIRDGEIVEIKVRSISEAGYPKNPAKSPWSESVTIEFPENLKTNDSITQIVESSKDDVTGVVLQQTMNAAGVYTHLNDTTEQYKHSADNIYYQQRITDDQANITVITTPLSDTVSTILKLLSELNSRVDILENK